MTAKSDAQARKIAELDRQRADLEAQLAANPTHPDHPPLTFEQRKAIEEKVESLKVTINGEDV